jgi:hypothetical protein
MQRGREHFGHTRQVVRVRPLAARAKSSKPLDPSACVVPSLAGSVGHVEDATSRLQLNVPVEVDA